MQTVFYVYSLIDPRTNTPFYIGKGKGKRCQAHFRQARQRKCKNKHLENKIRQIWNEGFQIDVDILFTTENEEDAYLKEIETIKLYGRRSNNTGPLVNLTEGGDGVRDWYANKTAEEIEAFKERQRINHAKYNTQEWRDRIAETCRNSWNDQKRIEHGNQVRQRYKIMSTDDRERHRINVVAAIKDVWSKMTPEERIERTNKTRAGVTTKSIEKISKKMKINAANETEEERLERINRHKKAAKNVDWQSINKKNANKRSEWSVEKKAEYSLKMAAAAKKRWEIK